MACHLHVRSGDGFGQPQCAMLVNGINILKVNISFIFSELSKIGGLHCRHVGVQNKRKFVHIV